VRVPVPSVWLDRKTSERRGALVCTVLGFSGGYECSSLSVRTVVKLEIEEEEPSGTIRSVIPGIPRSKKEKTQLEEDLREIKCHGFMKLPWNLRDVGMVRELMGEQLSKFSLTVRAKPEDWSPET